jgi:opacity protein-like surface antigen
MKRIIAAPILFLLSATGYAHHANPFWYAGAAYSILDVKLKDAVTQVDSEPGALNLVVGHEFNTYFAVEGLLGIGLYDDKVAAQRFAIELNSVVGVSAVGILPVSKTFSLYGKLGLAQLKYEDDKAYSADGNGLMYGIGAAFDVNEKFSFNVDYIQYPDADYNDFDTSVEAKSFNVGVNFKF